MTPADRGLAAVQASRHEINGRTDGQLRSSQQYFPFPLLSRPLAHLARFRGWKDSPAASPKPLSSPSPVTADSSGSQFSDAIIVAALRFILLTIRISRGKIFKTATLSEPGTLVLWNGTN